MIRFGEEFIRSVQQMSVVDVTLDFLRSRDISGRSSLYGWTSAQDQLARMLRRGMQEAEVAAATGRPLAAIAADVAVLARDLGVHTLHLRAALADLSWLDAEEQAGIDIDHFRTAFGLTPAR